MELMRVMGQHAHRWWSRLLTCSRGAWRVQARVANAEAERALRLSKEQDDLTRRAKELEAEAERHWQRAKQLGNAAGEGVASISPCDNIDHFCVLFLWKNINCTNIYFGNNIF